MPPRRGPQFAGPTGTTDAGLCGLHVLQSTVRHTGRTPRPGRRPVTNGTPSDRYGKGRRPFSSVLRSGYTSSIRLSYFLPHFARRVPFCGLGGVDRYDRQELGLGRANNVNRSTFSVKSEQQTAMAANVFRVILNDLTAQNYAANIRAVIILSSRDICRMA